MVCFVVSEFVNDLDAVLAPIPGAFPPDVVPFGLAGFGPATDLVSFVGEATRICRDGVGFFGELIGPL